MPLTLVTGPANAAKAGAVLERLRALRPQDPLLVVPTSADVDHYRRELAAAGIVFGAEVLTFRRLIGEIAAAAGVHGRPLGPVARDRVVRAAVRDTHLRVLAPSARAHGFTARGRRAVRRARALARHAGPLHARAARRGREAPAHAEELAALYSAYHRRLEGLGRRDEQGHARAALDALRERPAAWGARPVLLYGFDDLDALQLDAVETLAGRAGAEVWVALPYEAGRAAFAGHAATVELLKPLADAPRRARGPLGALRRARRGARCTTSSGGCSRAAASRARPTAPCGCWRPAASARRPSWWPPRCSS